MPVELGRPGFRALQRPAPKSPLRHPSIPVHFFVARDVHHQKSAVRPLQLEGRVAQVVKALEPEGAVLVGGELWRARTQSGDEIARGQVRIVGARGHWLEVEAMP